MRTHIKLVALALLTLALLRPSPAVGQIGEFDLDQYDEKTQVVRGAQLGDSTRVVVLPVLLVEDRGHMKLRSVASTPTPASRKVRDLQLALNGSACALAIVKDTRTPDNGIAKADMKDRLRREGYDEALVRGWKIIALNCADGEGYID
jgi:hypothetical protein